MGWFFGVNSLNRRHSHVIDTSPRVSDPFLSLVLATSIFVWIVKSVVHTINVLWLIRSCQTLPATPSLATVTDIIVNQKRGNCVPVFVQLPAELLTPVMAYLRLAKDSRYSFILESVTGGQNIGRYSFIGAGL